VKGFLTNKYDDTIYGPIPDQWLYLKSFACIRNPFDRFASCLHMFKTYKTKTREELYFQKSLTAQKVIDIIENKSIPINRDNYFTKLKLHAIPMSSDYFSLGKVDKIFRFEYFENEWANISNFLKIDKTPPLIHERKTDNKSLLSPSEKALVHDYFKNDFDEFGY
jgi:hypothetical protein